MGLSKNKLPQNLLIRVHFLSQSIPYRNWYWFSERERERHVVYLATYHHLVHIVSPWYCGWLRYPAPPTGWLKPYSMGKNHLSTDVEFCNHPQYPPSPMLLYQPRLLQAAEGYARHSGCRFRKGSFSELPADGAGARMRCEHVIYKLIGNGLFSFVFYAEGEFSEPFLLVGSVTRIQWSILFPGYLKQSCRPSARRGWSWLPTHTMF